MPTRRIRKALKAEGTCSLVSSFFSSLFSSVLESTDCDPERSAGVACSVSFFSDFIVASVFNVSVVFMTFNGFGVSAGFTSAGFDSAVGVTAGHCPIPSAAFAFSDASAAPSALSTTTDLPSPSAFSASSFADDSPGGASLNLRCTIQPNVATTVTTIIRIR
ncbi:penicillin-binding protein 1C, putative [Babesia ovata]|uniref:Penicillin-binding protein 1C, putative n=1 Tax=Babesia ovata TaxID=189622 RepID=A0A2H6K756_9APIC|nr:penicillin-binding protein 1C, putative [Babesia ovata]GBE58812.1 penicillin-binding protein 1C, putative [Babesia ovata]